MGDKLEYFFCHGSDDVTWNYPEKHQIRATGYVPSLMWEHSRKLSLYDVNYLNVQACISNLLKGYSAFLVLKGGLTMLFRIKY